MARNEPCTEQAGAEFVPDAAWDAVRAVVSVRDCEDAARPGTAVPAAAPHIARQARIAELTALVVELGNVRAEMREVDGRGVRSSALGAATRRIRERIAELNREGIA